MYQKNIYRYIYLFFFICFFFFWDINLYVLKNFKIGGIGQIEYLKISLNLLILILLFPLIYSFIARKSNLDLLKILKKQKNILYLFFFLLIHTFITSFFYNKNLILKDYLTLLFIFALGVIYLKYRNFLYRNFEKIIFLFIVILIFFSFNNSNKIILYNTGSCLADFYLINYFENTLNLKITNTFYRENSHLAMIIVAVLVSGTFFVSQNQNIYFKYISLFLIFILFILILTNSSSTFFVSYFISLLIFLFFFYKKILKSFWFYSFIAITVSIFFFFSDKNCVKKISDLNINDIIEKKLVKNKKNLTTLIYERSFIVAIDTVIYRPLGWGINGTLQANINLLNKKNYKDAYVGVTQLNLEDALGNFFKIINEFGVFSFIIFFMFLLYLLKLKKISGYNLFIITLFITQSIRGAGFFNGAFIFCIFEFLYISKLGDYFK
jgi:hypothetical protein